MTRWLPVVLLACATTDPAPVDMVGPPLVLSAPQAVTTQSLTFTVQGASPGATVALLFGNPAGGPDACLPLPGQPCIDIPAPATILGMRTASQGGIAQFTVTPPGGFGGVYDFQAVQAAPYFASNVHVVDLIEACAPPSTTDPVDGGAGLAPSNASFTVTFADPIADLQQLVLIQQGSAVPSSVVVAQNRRSATLTPNGVLQPNTTTTLRVTDPCGTLTTVRAATGNADAVGGANLVGNAFRVDTSNLQIVTPSGIGPLITPFLGDLDDRLIYMPTSWNSQTQTLSMRIGAAEQTQRNVQDPCVPTSSQDQTFFDDPEIGILFDDPSIQRFETVGTVDPSGTRIDQIESSGYIDADIIADALGVGGPIQCFLLGLSGISCESCPSTGGDCVFVAFQGIDADPFPGNVDVITDQDAIQACGAIEELFSF